MRDRNKIPLHILPVFWLMTIMILPVILPADEVEIGTKERDGTIRFKGLVLPGDSEDTFRLRGRFGTLTIQLNEDTLLGYSCFRSLDMEKRRVRAWFFDFSIPELGEQIIEKKLPKDLYVRKTYYPAETATADFQKDVTNRKLHFIDGIFTMPLGLHVPTRSEPWFSARIEDGADAQARRQTCYVEVKDQRIEFGPGVYPYVWGIVERKEIEPYGTEAEVFGTRKGGVVAANRVAIRPVGDPVAYENPDLPRYLFIGDSISIGYNDELRRLLAGKVNLYHPHTNCGPSGKGAGRVDAWLGAYEEPGRDWDVISFNFGHWDAGNSKEVYQRNLDAVIGKLKNTGAELIYVTTTPVDKGYPPAGDWVDKGAKGLCAPGRKHGVMEKYINPWALEVIRRHPEIAICDHWQIVKDGEHGLYKEWWHGRNVHFRKRQWNTPLAQALADKVMEALAKQKVKAANGRLLTPEPPKNAWEQAQVLGDEAGAGKIAEGPFEPEEESLQQFECPEWFREAKLGFWAHWGPQAVGGMGDKYAHGMYVQGDKGYNAHVKKYGHPSEFGYKDIIELWKAEKFTPDYADYLLKLYKQAGADFFVCMAHHHDNFDMWDSKYHSWNVVEKGPKKNIMAMWEKAARSNGLKFGVTSHVASAPRFFKVARGSDEEGPLAGVPYDGANQEYAELYCVDDWQSKKFNWPLRWYRRLRDVVDQHRPDILYFDGGVPFFDSYGKKLLAHYYNQNSSDHNGRQQGVVLSKAIEHDGNFTVWDFEYNIVLYQLPRPWVADTFLGHWYWNEDYEDGLIPYNDPDFLIDFLIDVVSKNGRVMMNIPQRADGTVHESVIHSLEEMAGWMTVNAESLHRTRPWTIYGEGPPVVRYGAREDALRIGEMSVHFYYLHGFNRQHIRFMQSRDSDTFYIFFLGWPRTYEMGWPTSSVLLPIRSLYIEKKATDAKLELLGSERKIPYKIDAEKMLTLTVPDLPEEELPCRYAYVFKLTGFDVALSEVGAARKARFQQAFNTVATRNGE